MTEKLFEQDAYLKECDAKVVKVEGNRVWLDRTVFFGFAGGQQSDSGTLNGRPVLEVAVDGEDIVHTLDEGHGLQVGMEARCVLDWAKRYKIMRVHSATHLVSVFVDETLHNPEYFGSNVSVDKGRLDLLWQENVKPPLSDWEAKTQPLPPAGKNHPCLPRPGQLRALCLGVPGPQTHGMLRHARSKLRRGRCPPPQA